MRTLAAMLAALTLAGCFSSEEALFGEDDGVAPITDGAIYEWRPSEQNGPHEAVVRFVRVDGGYELRAMKGDDSIGMRVMLSSISETRADDYIAQVEMGGESNGGFLYWFLWPLEGGGYEILTQAVAFDDTGQPTFDRCAEQLSGCRFDSADELRKHYLDVVYPLFASGRRPASYVDMIPAEPTPGSPESSRE